MVSRRTASAPSSSATASSSFRAERVLLSDEADESRKICAANRLVLTCETAELAEVGEPTRPVPAGEHREVVVVLGQNLLAESLEAHSGGGCDEAIVPLEKCPEQVSVLDREPFGQALLDCGEERSPRCIAPKQDERVVRDPDER